MKTTHKLLVINTLVAASFFMGAAGASADTQCSTGVGVMTTCSGSTPYCAYPDTGMWQEGTGSCQATQPIYRNRSSVPAGGSTNPLTTITTNPNGSITTCTCGACTTTNNPTTTTPPMNVMNPNVQVCEGNNGTWSGSRYYATTPGSVMGTCTCNAGFTASPSNPNICQSPMPDTCIMYGCHWSNGMCLNSNNQTCTYTPTNPGGANVFSAFWNFLTHRR